MDHSLLPKLNPFSGLVILLSISANVLVYMSKPLSSILSYSSQILVISFLLLIVVMLFYTNADKICQFQMGMIFLLFLCLQVWSEKDVGLSIYVLYMGFWYGCYSPQISTITYFVYSSGILFVHLLYCYFYASDEVNLNVLVYLFMPVVFNKIIQSQSWKRKYMKNYKNASFLWFSLNLCLPIALSGRFQLQTVFAFIVIFACLMRLTPHSKISSLKSIGLKIFLCQAMFVLPSLIYQCQGKSVFNTLSALQKANKWGLLVLWIEYVTYFTTLMKNQFLAFLLNRKVRQKWKIDILYQTSLQQQIFILSFINLIFCYLNSQKPQTANLVFNCVLVFFSAKIYTNWNKNRLSLVIVSLFIVLNIASVFETNTLLSQIRGCSFTHLSLTIYSQFVMVLFILLCWVEGLQKQIVSLLILFGVLVLILYSLIKIECLEQQNIAIILAHILLACLLCRI